MRGVLVTQALCSYLVSNLVDLHGRFYRCASLVLPVYRESLWWLLESFPGIRTHLDDEAAGRFVSEIGFFAPIQIRLTFAEGAHYSPNQVHRRNAYLNNHGPRFLTFCGSFCAASRTYRGFRAFCRGSRHGVTASPFVLSVTVAILFNLHAGFYHDFNCLLLHSFLRCTARSTSNCNTLCDSQ